MSGPSLAWALAAIAVGHSLGVKPLPPGISEAKVGHWNLKLNNGKSVADGVEPFGISLASDEYLAFGALHPSGGMIGGYTEDRLIDELVAFLPPEETAPFAEEIAARATDGETT